MKKTFFILPFVFVLFQFSEVNNALNAQNIITSQTELIYAKAQIDSLCKGYDYYQRFSGAILVKIGRDVLYQDSFGYQDFEKKQPNDNNTVFGIASCSKQFTATAILLLIEKGLLSLDDNVYKFIPSLGENVKKVTIRHLLTHTSGFSKDIGRAETWDKIIFPKSSPINHDSLIHLFGEIELNQIPGNIFDYTNHNYVVLAKIIEIISGKSYYQFLADEFWKPMNMNHTFFHQQNVVDSILAKPYGNLPIKYQAVEYWDDSWAIGAGGIYSNITDLSQWLTHLMNGKILSSQSTDMMFDKQKQDNNEFYGFGWQVTDKFNKKFVYHDGGTNGYYCKFSMIPQDSLQIILLCNHTHNLLELNKTSKFIKEINAAILSVLYRVNLVTKLPIPEKNPTPTINGKFVRDNLSFEILTSIKNDSIYLVTDKLDAENWSVFELPFIANIEEDSKRFQKVKIIADAFGKKDFKTILDNSSFVLRNLINEKKFAEIWQELARETGDFISWKCYKLPTSDYPNDYYIRLIYQKKELGLQLVFKGKKINGMFTDKFFTYNSPTKIELVPIRSGLFFVDGFKHGLNDIYIYQQSPNSLQLKVDGLTFVFTKA